MFYQMQNMRIQLYFGVSIAIISFAIILGFVVQAVHAGRGGGGGVGGGGSSGPRGGSPRFIAPPLIPSLLFGNRKSRCRPEMIVIAGAVGDECRKKALGPLRAHGNGVHCEPMRRSKSVTVETTENNTELVNAASAKEVEDEDENTNTNTNTNITTNINTNITATNINIDSKLNMTTTTMTEVVIECVCVWSADCFFERVDNGGKSIISRNRMSVVDFLIFMFVPVLL